MTTVITRLYPDPSAASAARATLLDVGQREETIRIITADGGAAAMKSARIPSASAAAYGRHMTGTEALLVVQAPFTPIGTALTAIRVLRKHPSIDVGLANENVHLGNHPTSYPNSVLTTHPLIMSNPFRPLPHGHIFGKDPILRGKPRTSAIRGGAHMSRYFWPMRLVSKAKKGTSAIHGGMLISKLLGLPVILRS